MVRVRSVSTVRLFVFSVVLLLVGSLGSAIAHAEETVSDPGLVEDSTAVATDTATDTVDAVSEEIEGVEQEVSEEGATEAVASPTETVASATETVASAVEEKSSELSGTTAELDGSNRTTDQSADTLPVEGARDSGDVNSSDNTSGAASSTATSSSKGSASSLRAASRRTSVQGQTDRNAGGHDRRDRDADLKDLVEVGQEIQLPEVLGKRVTNDQSGGADVNGVPESSVPGQLAQTGFSVLLFLAVALMSISSGKLLTRRPAAA